MGTATAGFSSSIQVSTDDGSSDAYADVGGANSVDASRSRESLDATDFSDTAFSRVMGLKDTTFSISGNADDSDEGQTDLDTQFEAGNDIYVQFLYDGTNGYKCACKVLNFDHSTAPDGKVEFSVSLEANGAWTSV